MKKEQKIRKAYTANQKINDSSELLLIKLNSFCIFFWNIVLEEMHKRLEEKVKNTTISPISMNYWLIDLRKTNLELQGINPKEKLPITMFNNDMLRQIIKKLSGSFGSFFELKKKGDDKAFPPRRKKYGDTITLSFSKGTFKIFEDDEKHFVSIPSIKGSPRIIIPIGNYLSKKIKDQEVVQFTLNKISSNTFKLNFVLVKSMPKNREKGIVLGIDLGAGNIAVSDSLGKEYLFPTRRPDKHWSPAIESLEKRLKGCKKGSRMYKKLMNTRRKLFNKSSNQKNSFQRKFSYFITNYSNDGNKVRAIIIGKAHTRLGLAKSSGHKKQHYSVQNTGYMFRLLLYIKEKCQERGIQVIEIADPKRIGEINDPESKFFASRELLKIGCKKLNIPFKSDFKLRKMSVPQ